MKRNNLQGQVVRLETEKLHLENEIERLNNNWNKLEKIMYLKYEEYDNIVKKNKSIANEMCRNAYWYAVHNIRELKGSGKE